MKQKFFIKYNDLYLENKKIKKKIINHLITSIVDSDFIGGNNVKQFENTFKKKLNIKYCSSVANGTDALFIAIKTLGLKKNQKVIVPAISWISTSEVVTLAGGLPVFCDVKDDYTINENLIENLIDKQTVGIIPVHLYGNPANMSYITNIAKKKKLWVIEDCAQAHFAKHKRKYVGSFGDIGTFSFFPGKNIGALGDAGAIVTNNKEKFEFFYKFSRHGAKKKNINEFEGCNSRLDSFQAKILIEKLKLQNYNQKKRNQIAKIYSKKIYNKLILKPHVDNNNQHVWHNYVIRCKKRDQLKKYLLKNKIETRINYPTALPFLKAYKRFKYKSWHYPNAFKFQKQILSLPIFPNMKNKEIKFIIKIINNFKY